MDITMIMDIIGKLHPASIIFNQDAFAVADLAYRETAMWEFPRF
jgi:hypothetical protein